jgi:succinate-acetate transporter protein
MFTISTAPRLTKGFCLSAFSLFFGGMLQLLACLMEWILGNTFSFLVFGSFGAAWTALSCTNLPAFDAMGAYTAGAKTAAEVASGQRAFQCDFGQSFNAEI